MKANNTKLGSAEPQIGHGARGSERGNKWYADPSFTIFFIFCGGIFVIF